MSPHNTVYNYQLQSCKEVIDRQSEHIKEKGKTAGVENEENEVLMNKNRVKTGDLGKQRKMMKCREEGRVRYKRKTEKGKKWWAYRTRL